MIRHAAAAILALACCALSAAPAPWYLWKSKSSGASACAQGSPGEGWSREDGPYKDSRCTLRIVRLAAAG